MPTTKRSIAALTLAHELPTLRVQRAWAAAEKLGEEHAVPRGVALAIAREVIATVADGTRRWGHLCVRCRSLLETTDGHLVCPEHGIVDWATPAVLLISFDPIGYDMNFQDFKSSDEISASRLTPEQELAVAETGDA